MTPSQRRLLFVLPCAADDNRGNATSAQRIAESLKRRGYSVEIVVAGSSSDSWPEFDLAVGFHAAHCGPQTQKIATTRKKPYVIAFTGTDLNGKPHAATMAAVENAAARVALCKSAASRARDLFPNLRGGVEVIFQAVAPLPYRAGAKLPPAAPALLATQKLVLVPAGVREIKDPLHAVCALTPLAALRPELRLWFVGPELETVCGEALRAAIADLDWAFWIGEVPRAELLPLMRRAALVLSTSRSEGAAPNSLLEATLAGTPVLASDIPAHKEFPGGAFCFRDDRLLRRKVEAIFDDSDLAAREVRKLQEVVRHKHGLQAEQLAWDRLLSVVLDPDKPRQPAKPMKPRKSELPKKLPRSAANEPTYTPKPAHNPDGKTESPWGRRRDTGSSD